MNLKIRAFVAGAVLAAVLLGVCGYARAERKNYTLIYSFGGSTSTAGKGTAEIMELQKLLLKKVKEKVGYDVTVVIAPKWGDVYKRLKSAKGVDMSFLGGFDYAMLKRDGFNLSPGMSPYYGYDERLCVFVNKNKKIKTAKDLKGKKVAIALSVVKTLSDIPATDVYERYDQVQTMSEFFILDKLLADAKVGGLKGSGAVFTVDFPNNDSKIIALDRGLLDGAMLNDGFVQMSKARGQSVGNLKKLVCTDKIYGGLFVGTSRVPADMIPKFVQMVVDFQSNPDPELKALLGRISPGRKAELRAVTDKDFKYQFDLWKWMSEGGRMDATFAFARELIEKSKKK